MLRYTQTEVSVITDQVSFRMESEEMHMKKYDIIVIGGGFAGAAAAISAARLGRSVLLAEKSNCLGGAATNCLVNPFMGNATVVDGKHKELSAGLLDEIREQMMQVRAENDEHYNEEVGGLFSEEHLKLVLNRMAVGAGVQLLFHAYLCDVNCTESRIESVKVITKAGQIELCADYYIDATGDADLAVLAGCSYRLGREADQLCQPMTLCFRIGNVDIEKFYQEKNQMQELYKQFQAEGKIKNPRENILVFRMPQKHMLHFNTTRIVKRNPVDPFDVTIAEIEAREQVFEVYQFMKRNFSCMANAELVSTAMEIGVRESRMINGEYLLTGKELMACCRFEDSIACGNYDIDIHNPEGSGTSHYYFPAGEYYEIPYRTMLPKEVENLLVTGRCLSVDHEAQASVRIMPIVCCLGEAAGVAAAVAADEGVKPSEADIHRIQEILTANGAVIH